MTTTTQQQTPKLDQTIHITAAAMEYIGRRDRTRHPDGESDDGGRWYPSDAENINGTITRTIRSPSRMWPWSYAHACRTVGHVAELFGVDATALRREARRIDAAAK